MPENTIWAVAAFLKFTLALKLQTRLGGFLIQALNYFSPHIMALHMSSDLGDC